MTDKKETLKEVIDEQKTYILRLEKESIDLKEKIIRLNNRLQLIKAQADVGFV